MDNPAFLDTIGWVSFLQGDVDKAITRLKQAMAAIPDDATVHCHLGLAYRKKGETEEARRHLEKEKALALNIPFSAKEQAQNALKELTKP